MTATKITIDPEFKALIPPLSAEEREQLEVGALAFEGFSRCGSFFLKLFPLDAGRYWWISCTDARHGTEDFTRRGVAADYVGFSLAGLVPGWPMPLELRATPANAITRSLMRVDRSPPVTYRLKTTNIYFIQSVHGGPVKVGQAVHVQYRLEALQNGNPDEMIVVKVIERVHPSMEKELHSRFKDYWVRGEWFADKVLGIDVSDLIGGVE